MSTTSNKSAERAADWQLAQRIANSRTFERAERLRAFLLFVVDRALNDAEAELTEQNIGVKVFERAEGYNPGEDSIVRSHARLLRQRLQSYYEVEGAGDRRRLSIPKGAYLPHFETLEGEEPAPVLTAALEEPPSRDLRRYSLSFVLGVALASLLAGVLGTQLLLVKKTPVHPFWSLLFEPNRQTMFVAGDTALVMLENLLDRPVSLSDYLSRAYRNDLPKNGVIPAEWMLNFANRRYTGVIDLQFLARLQSLTVQSQDFRVRFARDVQMQDLKESNVIVSGAHEANPWSELYRGRMNFVVERVPGVKFLQVRNRSPRATEAAIYSSNPNQSGVKAFGHIAYFPDTGNNGRLLLAEGTGSAGTEAAVDFLFSGPEFSKFLERIRKSNGQLPGFEILVSTDYIYEGKTPTGTWLTDRVY